MRHTLKSHGNDETYLKLEKKSVHNVYARNLVQLLQEQGVPVEQSLRVIGLSMEELTVSGGSISCAQELQLFSNTIVLTWTPDLGLLMGSRERVFHHGVYGYALQTAANVHTAFNILAKYFKLSNSYLCVDCKTSEGEYRFSVTEGFPMAGIHRLAVEEMLSATRNSFAALTEGQLKIRRMALDHPQPEYASRYAEIFQCPIEFDQQFTAPVRRVFKPGIWSLPLTARSLYGSRSERMASVRSRQTRLETTAHLLLLNPATCH